MSLGNYNRFNIYVIYLNNFQLDLGRHCHHLIICFCLFVHKINKIDSIKIICVFQTSTERFFKTVFISICVI